MKTDPQDDRLDKLFAAARRADHYDKEREQGFEARVIAKIRSEREKDASFIFWSWRLIPLFATVVIILGLWMSASDSSRTADAGAFAGIDGEQTIVVASLAGE